MQQSKYSVFYNRDIPIELSLSWQGFAILLLLVFYHWNLCSE